LILNLKTLTFFIFRLSNFFNKINEWGFRQKWLFVLNLMIQPFIGISSLLLWSSWKMDRIIEDLSRIIWLAPFSFPRDLPLQQWDTFFFLAARWQIWIWKTETLEVCQQHFIFVFPLGIHLFTWFHNIMPEWLLIYSRFQTLKSLFIWIWMKINCYIKTSFNLIFKLRKASKWELEKFGPCGKRLLVLWSTNQNERAHLETAANFFKKYRPPFHIDFIAKEVGALRQEKPKKICEVSVSQDQ